MSEISVPDTDYKWEVIPGHGKCLVPKENIRFKLNEVINGLKLKNILYPNASYFVAQQTGEVDNLEPQKNLRSCSRWIILKSDNDGPWFITDYGIFETRSEFVNWLNSAHSNFIKA